MDLKTGEIVQLYIIPEYARKRIGTQLLEALIDKARAAGLRELHLISSLNAEFFYSNAGFQSGSKCKHQFPDGDEIDCISMKKILVME